MHVCARHQRVDRARPVGAPRAERKHASRQKIASNRPRVGGRFIKAASNPTPAPDASSGTDSEAESEPGAPAEGAKEGPSADADATVEAVASPSERFAPRTRAWKNKLP